MFLYMVSIMLKISRCREIIKRQVHMQVCVMLTKISISSLHGLSFCSLCGFFKAVAILNYHRATNPVIHILKLWWIHLGWFPGCSLALRYAPSITVVSFLSWSQISQTRGLMALYGYKYWQSSHPGHLSSKSREILAVKQSVDLSKSKSVCLVHVILFMLQISFCFTGRHGGGCA